MADSSNPRFLEILQVRAEYFGDEEMAEPENLATFLKEQCDLPQAKAEAIVRSENTDLDEEEVDEIADTFHLHGDILKCVLTPPSSEVLHHALMDLVGEEDSFNVEHCEECVELAQRVQEASPSDARSDLLDLCYDILDHVIIRAYPEGAFDMLNEEDMPFLASLIPAFMQLDEPARRRVLAYTYQELAHTTDGVSAKSLAAYSRLRTEHFSPLVRQVFDALSEAPDGTLTAEELAQKLHLPDTRPLGAVAKATEDALAALETATGHHLEEKPLEVVDDSPLRFCLSPAACQAWQALSLADAAF